MEFFREFKVEAEIDKKSLTQKYNSKESTVTAIVPCPKFV